MPLPEVKFDPLTSIWQGCTAADEDNSHDDWEAYREVHYSSGETHTIEHTEPNDEPVECKPSHCFADYASTGIGGIRCNTTCACESARDWVDISDNIAIVEVLASILPR